MKALIVFGGLWLCLAGLVVLLVAFAILRFSAGDEDEWHDIDEYAAQMQALAPRRPRA